MIKAVISFIIAIPFAMMIFVSLGEKGSFGPTIVFVVITSIIVWVGFSFIEEDKKEREIKRKKELERQPYIEEYHTKFKRNRNHGNCPECNGRGYVVGCEICGGIPSSYETFDDDVELFCKRCRDKGKPAYNIDNIACQMCGGTGYYQ